ncbi:MAG TPA: HTTM domain-containing protein [Capsulimonadaceae bacterium]|nr:HTTM domain-containing protein [Capsulimonadaceae bacterium]
MSFRQDWNEFWFKPRPSGPLGLYRVLFGLLVLSWCALLAPDLFTWYSERGVMPLKALHAFNPGSYPYELDLLRHVTDPRAIVALFAVLSVAALFLTIGFCTRTSTIVTWVLLLTFQHRNEIILNSGDIFMRIMCFYLMFAPAGASCSVDRLIRIWRGKESAGDPPLITPWAQRLIQVQISIVYLATVLGKATGPFWQNGTAVYYPLHMKEMQRFWLPFLGSTSGDTFHMVLLNLLTYGTMAVELSMATLIWVPRLRGYVLAAGTALHVGIEYMMNIPLFSALMITSYVNFVPNAWIERFVAFWTRVLWRSEVTIRYAERGSLPALIAVLSRTDCLHLAAFAPLVKSKGDDPDKLIEVEDRRGRVRSGFAGLRWAMWRMPGLWLKALLCCLPGMVKVGDWWLRRWASDTASRPVAAVQEVPVSVRTS